MTDTERDPADESQVFEYAIGDDETVVEAVLHAVSEVTDRRPPSGVDGPGPNESEKDRPGVDEPEKDGAKTTDGESERIPPLYHAVDPDALVALSTGRASDVRVTFSYVECRVTVVGTDAVLVSDSSPPTDSGD